MNPTVIEPTRQDNSPENLFDVGGYSAIVNPSKKTSCRFPIGDATGTENDGTSLTKLWMTGLDVTDLMDAFNRFRIAPIREVDDCWKVLSYGSKPKRKTQDVFHVGVTTALAFLYPIPHEVGKTYTYEEYIRLRPRESVFLNDKDGSSKYLQPSSKHTATHSEPYFLVDGDTWTRVMSDKFPLFITEGECKAISLGLAGLAAIGFPGAQMMYADKKAGKCKLHPSLDPEGPRKGRTIPIMDRDIFIVPDGDFIDNKDVRLGFKTLVKNLAIAGASIDRIKMVMLPRSDKLFEKVGVDDFLTARLGSRWGGEETKVIQARSLIEELIDESKHVNLNEYIYPATSCIRGADRFITKFDAPSKYLAVVRASDTSRHTMWAMYNCDHYMTFPVNLPLNGVSSKVAFKADLLANMARETWDEGVRIAAQEGDSEEDFQSEMAADYPNRVYGLVSPQLDARYNETLIEPFEGVDVDDRCVRIKGGLINVTQCFLSGVDWDKRTQWLLPPNYRWFGTAQVNVSFTNLDQRPTCPTWLGLLHNMFDGDPVKIDCLQKAFGKILLCPMFLDRNQFFAFYGTAGSGKSTSTNILTLLMGEHDVAVLRGNFGGRFDTSELPGKRLALFPENEDGSNHHFTPEMAATIKKVTGRDMLVCERKGQQPITFRADAEILIVGNAPPTIEMDDEAFKRRAVFCRAVNKIQNPDHGKSKEIMETVELPGIFLWALEGAYKLWKGEVFETPTDCLDDLQHSTLNMNLEKRFVQQMIVEKDGKKLFMTDVEEMYRQWLRHNRLANREPGWGKLAGAIREKFEGKYKSEPGKDTARNSTRFYTGLAFAEMLY